METVSEALFILILCSVLMAHRQAEAGHIALPGVTGLAPAVRQAA